MNLKPGLQIILNLAASIYVPSKMCAFIGPWMMNRDFVDQFKHQHYGGLMGLHHPPLTEKI